MNRRESEIERLSTFGTPLCSNSSSDYGNGPPTVIVTEQDVDSRVSQAQ